MSTCPSQCEHLLAETPEEKLRSIQNELIWGLAYRNYKENEKKHPISPMHSPLNIPFELCRAKMVLKQRKQPAEFNLDEEELEIKPQETKLSRKRRKRRKISREKPTLLDRNVWSQNKYMEYLSLPNPKFYENAKKKYKKRCELEPCPPRFVQLAIPNKRRVYANWKDYADLLPTEMLMRYEEILHTHQNLEPKEARYYYKTLDRQKHKEQLKKKRQAKLKQQAKQKDSGWLKDLTKLLAGDIVSYIQDEPLFALNYKQMLLSDGILERLDQTKMLKKPSRKTKSHYKKTIVEVSDKMAVWIDTLTRFVDVQAIDSMEDIPPVSISSLGEGESEEGESSESYESTTDEEQLLDDEQWFEKVEGEEDAWIEDETKDAEAVAEGILKPGHGEGPAELDEVLNGLDGDILEKLINILSKCSNEFLDSLIEENQLPDITYRDVLDRLIELKKKLDPAEGDKSFLEQIMVDWAMKNDPDNVNDKVLKKIHEVAAILEDMLAKKATGEISDVDDIGKEGGENEEQELLKEDDEKPEEGGDIGESDEVATEEEGATAPTEEEELPDADKKDEGEEAGDADVEEEGGLVEEVKEGEEEQAKDAEEAVEEEKGEDQIPEDELKDKDEEPSEVPDETELEKEPDQTSEGSDEEISAVPDEDLAMVPEEEPSTVPDEEPSTIPDEKPVMVPDEEPATIPDEEDKEADTVEDKPKEVDEEKEEGAQELEEEEIEIDIDEEATKEEEESVSDVTESKTIDFDESELNESEEEEEESVGARPSEELDYKVSRLDGERIKGHKPYKVVEHSPDTVCCLSLKIWAVWLIEITHNAHNWTQWMSCVIQKVREFASIVRGDVKEPDGRVKVLKKSEWRSFIAETEESIVAWRQYSAHVKDLSQTIVDNFHGKHVQCCPKCLQDHLITNVVSAHDTLQSLTEAINCAAYWQRCLDNLVDKACQLAQTQDDIAELDSAQKSTSSESEIDEAVLEEVVEQTLSQGSGESVYEIEGFDSVSKRK